MDILNSLFRRRVLKRRAFELLRLRDLAVSGEGKGRLEALKRIDADFKVRGGLGMPRTDVETLLGFFTLVQSVAKVEGDIVECGVGMGRSLHLLTAAVSFLGLSKRIHGYDSFEGFPEPAEQDKSFRDAKKGDWQFATEELVYQRFVACDMVEAMLSQVALHKGFFSDTIPTQLPQKICFLHIDADLYESYRIALQYGYPRCSAGAIICFDEYNEPQWPGATLAVDEFMKGIPEQLQWHDKIKKWFLVKT